MRRGLLYGSIITTYRCNARCNMCGCFKHPTRKEEEFSPEILTKLPRMSFVNVTGGEPFIRDDLEEIIRILYTRTGRIVVSTNGYFSDRILRLCETFPSLGIRISIEGLPQANDEIRGLKNGFDRALRTLLTLAGKGHKDIGFGMTVQDLNYHDLMPLYRLSKFMGMEFATATLHNSHYFRKNNNEIKDKKKIAEAFEALINAMLKSGSPKKWFRAYFNHGLINYIYGNPRYLPCGMGENGFFLDPYGDVLPCNGMAEKQSMGNLNDKGWEEIWYSERAAEVRENVKRCDRNCWMIGSAAPAMKKDIWTPLKWVARHKWIKPGYRLDENPFIKDLKP